MFFSYYYFMFLASKSTTDQRSSPRQRRDSDIYFGRVHSLYLYAKFVEENVDDKSSRSQSPSPHSQQSETFNDLFAEPPPPKRRANDSHSPSPTVRTPRGMAKV